MANVARDPLFYRVRQKRSPQQPVYLNLLITSLAVRVDSTSALVPGESATIDGVNFGASQGTVTLGGVSQTVTGWTNTQITITVVQSNLQYFAYHNLAITAQSGQVSLAFPAPITLPAGHTAVDLLSIESEADYRITAIPDLEIGDQLEARNVVGGDVSGLTLLDDATFIAVNGISSFEVRAWDHDDETWGDWAVQVVQQLGVGLGESMTTYIGLGVRIGL